MPPGTQPPRCLIKMKTCVQARIPRCPLLPSNLFLLPDLKVLAENLLQAQGAHILLRAFTLPSPKQPVGKQILCYFSTRHKTFLCTWRYTICVCSVAQSFLTLCDPMDWSPPGILQARMLAWIAMPSSRGSSQPRDPTLLSCVSCIGRQDSLPLTPSGKPSKICRCYIINFKEKNKHFGVFPLCKPVSSFLAFLLGPSFNHHAALPVFLSFWALLRCVTEFRAQA